MRKLAQKIDQLSNAAFRRLKWVLAALSTTASSTLVLMLETG